MFLKNMLPILSASTDQIINLDDETKQNLYKKFRIRTLGLGFHAGTSYLQYVSRKRSNFEDPPYDFNKIIQAIDTDSYVKQAFWKYRDLFWKEGWDIVSENKDAVSYLYQRIDLIEEAMGRPFEEFLIEVVDQLIRFSNVFIAVVRADIGIKNYNRDNGESIVGFYVIPTETVRVLRDKHNKPLAYKQNLDEYTSFANNVKEPVWDAKNVIHLHLDKKPGYAFGTPFLTAALDDILSIRQIEEDLLNLIHRELFPLYKYKVGTEMAPAQPEELNDAAAELANLRVEGGLVIPERHDVEVIGAQHSSLQITEYLNHFKERVAVGLGVYPHHLGMSTDSTNRSATDRLDAALYDRIKSIQEYFEEAVRFNVFNKLLLEGGFDPMVHPHHEGESDRCYMRFREIDIDTQIKKENHTINKFNSNLIDWSEAREELAKINDADPAQLLISITSAMQVMVANQTQTQTQNGDGKAPAPKTSDGNKSSSGSVPNLPNPKRGSSNSVAPMNQHGRRSSPNIRHSLEYVYEEDRLSSIVELIDDQE